MQRTKGFKSAVSSVKHDQDCYCDLSKRSSTPLSISLPESTPAGHMPESKRSATKHWPLVVVRYPEWPSKQLVEMTEQKLKIVWTDLLQSMLRQPVAETLT